MTQFQQCKCGAWVKGGYCDSCKKKDRDARMLKAWEKKHGKGA